jgi:hypothetical protein
MSNNIQQAALNGIIAPLPIGLEFDMYFADISMLSNILIQNYIVELFNHLITLPDDELIRYMTILDTSNERQYSLKEVLGEGKCLSVSIRDKFVGTIRIGISTHIEKVMEECDILIPPLGPVLRDFEVKKDMYNKQLKSNEKSTNCNVKDEEKLEEPEFIWKYRVGNSCAIIKDYELKLIPLEVSAMVLSGIGIYDPICIPDLQNSISIREAIGGRLSILFSTPDITYGTNMALISVYIDKYYGRQATHNSIYQLIGRVGRVGKSFKGRVLFEDINSMKKALLDIDDKFEARVMNYYLSNI